MKYIKKQSLYIICGAAAVVALAVGSGLIYSSRQEMKTPSTGPLSRQVMTYAEHEVTVHREPPPLAALHYAYIASAYSDALGESGQNAALYASRAMLLLFYPSDGAATNTEYDTLAAANRVDGYNENGKVPSQVATTIEVYQSRYASDGHDLVWDGIIPTGSGKWLDTTGLPPVTPRAGDWKRWIVHTPIQVPPPPVLGSPEDNKQLNIVVQAVAGRTGEDVQKINFWAGSIGTATPAGIWQNQLFITIQKNLSSNALIADRSYALIQKNVAQTMSDAFMECWKVKYTYWTARPDQRLPGLITGMPDPNFPSYISGHSTVSKAAADVLSVMVPQYKDTWEAMAAEARYSRLVAGIHFDVDNSVGFDVGSKVANQAVSNLHLTRVL